MSYDLGRKPLYYILALFLITVDFLLLYGAAMRFYGATIVEENEQHDFSGYALLTSPHCFAYTDAAIGRTYPGVIDIKRVNYDVLRSCLAFSEHISARLAYNDKEIVLGEMLASKEKHPVIVVDGDARYPGTLEVML